MVHAGDQPTCQLIWRRRRRRCQQEKDSPGSRKGYRSS